MKISLPTLLLLVNALFWSSPTFADKEMDNSLIYYTYFGKEHQAVSILEKGANPNAVDKHQWPALAIAADRSDAQSFPIAKALIEAGADINAGHNHNYPITNAIKNANLQLAELLINKGVNLRVHNQEGTPLLTLAKDLGDERIINLVEKILFEQKQTQDFLTSQAYLNQLTTTYKFNHCAVQYWNFYLRSKQDKDMNADNIKDIITFHANKAVAAGYAAAQYFPQVYTQSYEVMAGNQRATITENLNSLISNRNRRSQGVGTAADLAMRCKLSDVPTYFHSSIMDYAK